VSYCYSQKKHVDTANINHSSNQALNYVETTVEWDQWAVADFDSE